jgi:O-antigen/teichoic acid export membrane protein
MRVFYRWVAVGVLVLLLTAGTAYFWFILKKYTGDRQDALVAWIILVTVNCYNIYTLYYDSLLTGKGYIKRNQQIIIIGQATYLVVAIGLIYAGLGLTAIVSAQLLSYIIKRTLSRRVFFTKEMHKALDEAVEQDYKAILKVITPNSLRVGLTNLGGFVVTKSALFIGSAFLPLAEIAAFGITMQVMDVLARCGSVMYQSYIPRLAQCRAERDIPALRRYYRLSVAALVAIYIIGGAAFVLLGDMVITLLRSDTSFLPTTMLCAVLVISLLEQNHVLAATFIMADNKIPFMWPSLISGAATIVLLLVMLGPIGMGLWGMILAPGIAQLAYQNWRWPSMVIRELR